MSHELLSIQLDEGHLMIPLHLIAEHRATVHAEKDAQKPHSKLWERIFAETFAYPQLAAEWVLNHLDIDEIIEQVQFIPNHRYLSTLFAGFYSTEQVSITNLQKLRSSGVCLNFV